MYKLDPQHTNSISYHNFLGLFEEKDTAVSWNVYRHHKLSSKKNKKKKGKRKKEKKKKNLYGIKKVKDIDNV